jgi:tetratricopeptide (TPR) repeat protein
MQIPLNSPLRRKIVVGAAVIFALAYLTLTGRLFLAALFGNRVELSSLRRATRLDQGNADYQNHLGRYFALVARDPSSAIAPYRAAVQLDPHSARYWFDLASAYQVLGDTQNQTLALEEAVHADPTTPDVAWEAANLYLVQGEDENALREFRVVMEGEPTLSDAAIRLCWRIRPDVDALLRDVVPARSEAYIAFLNLLMSKQEPAASAKVWAALAQTPDHFGLPFVFDYFNFLILHKDPEDALRVWQQAASRFALSAYLPSSRNLIVNGDFSLEVLNGGFDWQYRKQPSVTLALDPSEFHSGRRSLLISFDGPGVSDAGILQFIPVQPDTTYQFSAYYKNGELEGAGGPHFTLQDMYTSAILYESDELNNAGFWKSVTGEFTTGPDSRLLMLHVRRVPEGGAIRGKLWVDDFHLVRQQE